MKNNLVYIRIYKSLTNYTFCEFVRHDGTQRTFCAERGQQTRRDRIAKIADSYPHKTYITHTQFQLFFTLGKDVQDDTPISGE